MWSNTIIWLPSFSWLQPLINYWKLSHSELEILVLLHEQVQDRDCKHTADQGTRLYNTLCLVITVLGELSGHLKSFLWTKLVIISWYIICYYIIPGKSPSSTLCCNIVRLNIETFLLDLIFIRAILGKSKLIVTIKVYLKNKIVFESDRLCIW